MTVTEIRNRLFELKEDEYATFQAKLTPGISRGDVIGVRVPEVRKLAKEIVNEGEFDAFLADLPHRYYDENMVHGIIISELKNSGRVFDELEKFLPFVDNWAVCDIMNPKVIGKHKEELLGKIYKWTASDRTYTIRFGTEMLMTHFLGDNLKTEYLDLVAGISSEEYYVKMMNAWYFATALAKNWNETIPYIEKGLPDIWVHNKTIQKARESYRITQEQKDYLLKLKIKQKN